MLFRRVRITSADACRRGCRPARQRNGPRRCMSAVLITVGSIPSTAARSMTVTTSPRRFITPAYTGRNVGHGREVEVMG